MNVWSSLFNDSQKLFGFVLPVTNILENKQSKQVINVVWGWYFKLSNQSCTG